MHAEIIAVGTELTSGQKLDTNSQWLAQRLGEVGVEVRYHSKLADDLTQNVEGFRVASGRASLVIISGGLGPTQDDLTRSALATLAGVALVEDLPSLRAMEELFARRNRRMTPNNRVQALLPEGADALANPIGTAPGIWMKVGEVVFVALPGVPGELYPMYTEQVLPRLRAHFRLERVIRHRVIHLFGMGEAEVESHALDITARGRTPEVGITASDATISFRITGEGANEAEADAQIEPTARLIYERFGELIIGEGATDVPEAVVGQLARTGLTLAVAESCTGGLIAKQLTDVAGVSAYFHGGAVSYANKAKEILLGVRHDLIEAHGAVSPEVAEAMAAGIRERLGAAIGLSVTGIAGPGGGSTEKPVGLVYVGLAREGSVAHRKLLLGPEQPRAVIRSRAAKHALNWVRLVLKKLPAAEGSG